MEIYTELTNSEVEEAVKPSELGIKQRLKVLWGVFKDIEGDREFEELKRKVKFDGYLFSFDLRNVTEGQVEEYFDGNNVKIKGCRKINIQEYWDELEMRESDMKKVIRSLYNSGEQGEIKIDGHENE